MTDIHSHILFDVDDGSSNIDESIALLKELENIGFENIILTPHYIEDSHYKVNHYRVSNDVKRERFKILVEEVKKNNIDINLFLGNEIFISNDIVELVDKDEIHPLADTNYLLIEFPFHTKLLNLEDTLYEIENRGYIPIIAHPERYTYFHDNYKLVDNLKREGLLFQCNYSSILGYYGKEAQKLFKYMLKKGYVDYLGTDIHHIDKKHVVDNFPKILKKIKKYAGEDNYNRIVENCDNLVK